MKEQALSVALVEVQFPSNPIVFYIKESRHHFVSIQNVSAMEN
jgi:hypothetical protein